jgi:hypothetical protein
MTVPAPDLTRQTYTCAEVAAITGIPYGSVKHRVRTKGEVLGVKPLANTGRRKYFSAKKIQRAIEGEEA